MPLVDFSVPVSVPNQTTAKCLSGVRRLSEMISCSRARSQRVWISCQGRSLSSRIFFFFGFLRGPVVGTLSGLALGSIGLSIESDMSTT